MRLLTGIPRAAAVSLAALVPSGERFQRHPHAMTKIWGWDYPMIAMTATRLGRPEDAVDILLRDGPNNLYLLNGHCPQRVDESVDRRRKREIPAYLPANGALLSVVALMAGGWDGCGRSFPGFAGDGIWKVRTEGLKPSP